MFIVEKQFVGCSRTYFYWYKSERDGSEHPKSIYIRPATKEEVEQWSDLKRAMEVSEKDQQD